MIRFLHSSDLHLGKPFGRYPEDVRVPLRQARAQAVNVLADLARAHHASHIVLAGDTFDQTTPAPRIVRHAMNAMREAAHVRWVLMPGNHDHANATELWRQIRLDAPENVILATEPAPISLSDDVTLLPAPPTDRHPGRDLTEWFDTAPTGDALRIGLAHGSVTDFDSSEDGGSAVIPPNRARRAGLAYLALGDWHGQLQIGPETWYSGAPEADGFKHDKTPSALLVEIAGPTAPARVTPVPTGTMRWQRSVINLTEGVTPEAMLAAVLPSVTDRARTLLDLVVTGRARAPDRVTLERAIAAAAPDFLWQHDDLSGLGLIHNTDDLDVIDAQGALRAAAESLSRDATDQSRSPEDRATAQTALSLLFSYALED
ncbi:DNA repair exonuclease [Pseudoruegeria sp. SK021]|uniref:metallophosphoesterase family protein n=1 Tax=Pseudoruegeria sp. SK021 TaxID=1933035 RepID=UPI000A239737|nr:DNA repair exonuclease [Pseudoruegeria sp. SK021]OSP54366.1 hypothetical protein BV911_12860 [Pseudoruegeria sp. SK021]